MISSEGKTPEHTLAAQLYVSVKNPNSIFQKIGERPAKFSLKEWNSSAKPEETPVPKPVIKTYSERDLHPLLTHFARKFMDVYTKTIYHEKSKAHGKFSQWLHPDLVGVYFPFGSWAKAVVEFGMGIGSRIVKLYSFEMKKQLNTGNLRESFFQAVSNSSWANEGYLVASEISSKEDFRAELKRLSASFGIGIIELNTAEPDRSTILFPAKERDELDWETINKLCKINGDFRDFLERVRDDISIKKIIVERYDKLYTVEELRRKFKD